MSVQFLVIAYDIADNRRRYRLEKLLKGYGVRMNYSVFECLVKKTDMPRVKEKIAKIINTREDSVLFYPLCQTCLEKRDTAGWRNPDIKTIGIIV